MTICKKTTLVKLSLDTKYPAIDLVRVGTRRFVCDISVTILNKIKRINHSCQPWDICPLMHYVSFVTDSISKKNILLKDCSKRDCLCRYWIFHWRNIAYFKFVDEIRYLNFSTNIIVPKNTLRNKYIIQHNTLAIHPYSITSQ